MSPRRPQEAPGGARSAKMSPRRRQERQNDSQIPRFCAQTPQKVSVWPRFLQTDLGQTEVF